MGVDAGVSMMTPSKGPASVADLSRHGRIVPEVSPRGGVRAPPGYSPDLHGAVGRTKTEAISSRSPLVSSGTLRQFTTTSSRIDSGNVRKRSSYYSPSAMVSKESPLATNRSSSSSRRDNNRYSTPSSVLAVSANFGNTSYQTPVHQTAGAAGAATPHPSDWDSATAALQAQIAAMQASHEAEMSSMKEQLAIVSPSPRPAAAVPPSSAAKNGRRSNPVPVLAVGAHAPRSSPSPTKSGIAGGSSLRGRGDVSTRRIKANPKPVLAVGDNARVSSRQHAERLAAAGFTWQDDDFEFNVADQNSIGSSGGAVNDGTGGGNDGGDGGGDISSELKAAKEYASQVAAELAAEAEAEAGTDGADANGGAAEDLVAQVRAESAARIEQLKLDAEAARAVAEAEIERIRAESALAQQASADEATRLRAEAAAARAIADAKLEERRQAAQDADKIALRARTTAVRTASAENILLANLDAERKVLEETVQVELARIQAVEADTERLRARSVTRQSVSPASSRPGSRAGATVVEAAARASAAAKKRNATTVSSAGADSGSASPSSDDASARLQTLEDNYIQEALDAWKEDNPNEAAETSKEWAAERALAIEEFAEIRQEHATKNERGDAAAPAPASASKPATIALAKEKTNKTAAPKKKVGPPPVPAKKKAPLPPPKKKKIHPAAVVDADARIERVDAALAAAAAAVASSGGGGDDGQQDLAAEGVDFSSGDDDDTDDEDDADEGQKEAAPPPVPVPAPSKKAPSVPTKKKRPPPPVKKKAAPPPPAKTKAAPPVAVKTTAAPPPVAKPSTPSSLKGPPPAAKPKPATPASSSKKAPPPAAKPKPASSKKVPPPKPTKAKPKPPSVQKRMAKTTTDFVSKPKDDYNIKTGSSVKDMLMFMRNGDAPPARTDEVVSESSPTKFVAPALSNDKPIVGKGKEEEKKPSPGQVAAQKAKAAVSAAKAKIEGAEKEKQAADLEASIAMQEAEAAKANAEEVEAEAEAAQKVKDDAVKSAKEAMMKEATAAKDEAEAKEHAKAKAEATKAEEAAVTDPEELELLRMKEEAEKMAEKIAAMEAEEAAAEAEKKMDEGGKKDEDANPFAASSGSPEAAAADVNPFETNNDATELDLDAAMEATGDNPFETASAPADDANRKSPLLINAAIVRFCTRALRQWTTRNHCTHTHYLRR